MDYESEYYTDDDGYLWIAMVIGQGWIGTYIISLEFGTTYNMPIKFKTTFPIDEIEIIQIPEADSVESGQ